MEYIHKCPTNYSHYDNDNVKKAVLYSFGALKEVE